VVLPAPSASVSSRPAVRLALISVEDPSGVLAHKAISSSVFPHGPNFRSPPSCTPSLPRHYPRHRYCGCSDSGAEGDAEARSAPRGGWYLGIFIFSCAAQLSSLHVLSLQSLPSPTTQPPQMIALTPTFSASWASCSQRSGLRLPQQARQSARPNRVCFRYGQICSPSVAPTPPRGDAVTVGYGPMEVDLKRTCISRNRTRSRAHEGRPLWSPCSRQTMRTRRRSTRLQSRRGHAGRADRGDHKGSPLRPCVWSSENGLSF